MIKTRYLRPELLFWITVESPRMMRIFLHWQKMEKRRLFVKFSKMAKKSNQSGSYWNLGETGPRGQRGIGAIIRNIYILINIYHWFENLPMKNLNVFFLRRKAVTIIMIKLRETRAALIGMNGITVKNPIWISIVLCTIS